MSWRPGSHVHAMRRSGTELERRRLGYGGAAPHAISLRPATDSGPVLERGALKELSRWWYGETFLDAISLRFSMGVRAVFKRGTVGIHTWVRNTSIVSLPRVTGKVVSTGVVATGGKIVTTPAHSRTPC